MKESNYNIWLSPGPGVVLCYNAITGGFAEMDEGTYKQFKNAYHQDKNSNEVDEQLLDNFKKGGMLIDNNLDEDEMLKCRFLQSSYGSRALGLTILPTLDCNFKCNYCYEKNKFSSMSDDVVKAIKDFISNKIKNDHIEAIFVSWFGGEPLLELNKIIDISKYIIDLCNKNSISYSSHMVSNCSLLDNDKAKLLSDLKISEIQATIDGPRVIHDKRRIFKNGNPTFDKILGNILASSEYVKFAVRINTDKYFLNTCNELFDNITPLARKENIGIYPGKLSSDVTLTCSNIESMCLNVKEFADIYKLFYSKAISSGFNLSWKPHSTPGGCGATNIHSMVIEPNGNLCRCWSQVGEEDESYGNILNFNTSFKPNNYYKWLLFDPFSIHECLRCKFKPLCMGGCPATRVNATTDYMAGNNKRADKCSPIKYNLNDMLLFVYDQIKSNSKNGG